ncbi:MAG: hypothetical protein ABL962_07520 [Fimbriimonadaceae bacterium]
MFFTLTPDPYDAKAFKSSAPTRNLILALGDQIGDERVWVSPALTTADRNGTRFTILGASEAGVLNTIIQISDPDEMNNLDRAVSRVWPGWIAFRLGKVDPRATGTTYLLKELSSADLQEIKKLRPKMNVEVGP